MSERRFFSLRGFVALLAILGLTITLAGRVFHADIYHAPSAHSASAYEKVQQRDADASRWAPPEATYALLWTTERSPDIEPTEQVYFHPHYDSLYNRPPPVNKPLTSLLPSSGTRGASDLTKLAVVYGQTRAD